MTENPEIVEPPAVMLEPLTVPVGGADLEAVEYCRNAYARVQQETTKAMVGLTQVVEEILNFTAQSGSITSDEVVRRVLAVTPQP